MPHPDVPISSPELTPTLPLHEVPFAHMDVVELGAYKKWKADVPFEIRSLVEGKLMEKKVRLGREELPSVAEFYEGMKTLLVNPQADVTTLEIAPVIQKQLAALQRIKIGEGVVNVFAALADEKIGFEVKANYVATKLEPRLHFCATVTDGWWSKLASRTKVLR